MIYLRDNDPLSARHGYETPWHERVLDLWVEDDATQYCEGHENPQHAFVRICNQEPKHEIARFDQQGNDYFMVLYRSGWVITYTPSGGSVGVVVRIGREMGS